MAIYFFLSVTYLPNSLVLNIYIASEQEVAVAYAFVPSSDHQTLGPCSPEYRCRLARSVCVRDGMRGGEMQASGRGGDSFVRSDHETPCAFEHQTCLIKGTGLD